MGSSGFTFKVKMNPAYQIIREHGLDENGSATERLRSTVDRFCDPYIPFASGGLKGKKTYPNKHSIKYVSPYAHYHYKGKMYISPKLGVSGIVLKNGKWWSPKGEKKKATSTKLQYNGAPKRGPEWDKRMMNDRGKEVCQDVENFIKRGGK